MVVSPVNLKFKLSEMETRLMNVIYVHPGTTRPNKTHRFVLNAHWDITPTILFLINVFLAVVDVMVS